jgi:hypothetical protein
MTATALTAVGRISDPRGFFQQVSLAPGRDHPELKRDHWALPPEGYRRSQPPEIKLNVEHERHRRIGHVLAIEHDHRSGLWATCHINADPNTLVQLSAGQWFYSVETDARRAGAGGYREDAVLTGLALVRRPAASNAIPSFSRRGSSAHTSSARVDGSTCAARTSTGSNAPATTSVHAATGRSGSSRPTGPRSSSDPAGQTTTRRSR